jgi:hypothetical protein
MLTDPAEVQHAISKASGPDGIPNRALKHLLQRMILLLVVFSTRSSERSIFLQYGSILESSPF